MRFRIRHVTRYSYTRAVFIEPFVIRLRPRSDASQRLDRFELTVSPEPVGLTEYVDEHGNDVARAWFSGSHDTLTITTESEAVTSRVNPFDYLPLHAGLPMRYAPPAAAALAAYTDRSGIHPPVAALGAQEAERAGGDVVTFLSHLVERIQAQYPVVYREHGAAYPSHRTLELGSGSCRDVTVLFADACRAQGLAARFVSGYVEPEADADLHAWAEVFVPGGGWRGYDPTLGLAVGADHLAIAAGASAQDAAPTEGSFRGTGADQTLAAELDVTVCQDEGPDRKGVH